jgi:hypothetical protein
MKKLVVYTQPGHAGVAIENDSGSYTRFDFGNSVVGGQYAEISSTFNKIVSVGLLVATASAYTLTGVVAGAMLFSDPTIGTTAGILSGIYGGACAAYKGVLVEKDYDTYEAAKHKSDVNMQVFEITDEQRDYFLAEIEKSKNHWYSAALDNCSDFVKRAIGKAGIETSKRLINTPNSLNRQLESKV